MAKHKGRKKVKKNVVAAYQVSQSFDDPINSFFQAYNDDNYDDVIKLRSELRELRELVSQTLISNNRYRAEILESFNILNRLVGMITKLNSSEFEILNQRIEIEQLDSMRFQLNNIKIMLDKVNELDEELDKLNNDNIHKVNQYLVKHLKISDYLLNNGFLLIKIYYKILNLKNFLNDKLLNYYIKSRLLIIFFELTKINELLDYSKDSLIKDQDFKSVLISYKDFILVLINQLNDAIEERNSEQINECLNILKDVEKMYESFRMNFLFEQELEEYNAIMEDETPPTSTSTSTSITAELPYLLQAFDEANRLDKEISSYKDLNPAKSLLSTAAATSAATPNIITLQKNSMSKEPSHLHSHTKNIGIKGVGFHNSILNSIYGLKDVD